jgi:hypothetical protein
MSNCLCCDDFIRGFLRLSLELDAKIWELGCRGCTPNCICTIAKFTSAELANCTAITGKFQRTVVLELNSLSQNKINVHCLCGIEALSRRRFLWQNNIIYFTADEKYSLMSGGACQKTKTIFIVKSQKEHFPSLLALSQLALLKQHSFSNLKKLAVENHIPLSLLKQFPKIFYAASRLSHITFRGAHMLQISTCSEPTHPTYLDLCNEHRKTRDNINFQFQKLKY